MKWNANRVAMFVVATCLTFVGGIALLIYWGVTDRMDRDSPVLAARDAAAAPRPRSRLQSWIDDREAKADEARADHLRWFAKNWYWIVPLAGIVIGVSANLPH
jgi:hypothetical protein